MPDLDFQVTGVEAVARGLARLLHFNVAIRNTPAEETVHTVMLHTQIQVQAPQRSYNPAEKEKLVELFGTPDRWGQNPPLDGPQCDDQNAVIMRTFASTHTILRVTGGEFISLLDTPAEFKTFADQCKNIGTWPILVGEENQGERDTMLSSPIILYDYPQVAPESPGSFFDGTEIDEMLALRVLIMTDGEKQEMRQVDEFARRILERTEAEGTANLLKLHGTLREVIRELQRGAFPEGVTAVDFGIRSHDLAYALTGGYDAVIMVDAASRGGTPGTLYLIEPEVNRTGGLEQSAVDAHTMNPVSVIQMAQSLGGVSGKLNLTALYVILGVIGLIVIIGVIVEIPELRRYFRMRKM